MKHWVILRVLIILLGFVGLAMIFPFLIALGGREPGTPLAFGIPMGIMLATAGLTFFFTWKKPVKLSATDGFLLVFLAWIFTCVTGALPFLFSRWTPNFTDAVFESVSGFTTTWATIIPDVEALPRSLLLWRGMTNWLGGMGVVTLTVLLLPMLGVGGFQLFQVESAFIDSSRITPRVTKTAKILWVLYISFTVIQALLLWLCGMEWFDAALHALSTIGTGGFSARNASVGGYGSPLIEWIFIIFMLIAGFNFNLIYRLLQGNFREMRNNSEARGYGLIIFVSVLLIILAFRSDPAGRPVTGTLRYAFFHTASMVSTTGFSIENHNQWRPLAQGALFSLMFIGGCSGSAAGGVKVIRYIILFKQAGNEMKRELYPNGVFAIHLNQAPGRKELVYGTAGFIFMYFAIILGTFLLISPGCPNPFFAFNLSLLALGNIGLGLGNLPSNYAALPGYCKWVLACVMIIGRLELWGALVFFSREYWRR